MNKKYNNNQLLKGELKTKYFNIANLKIHKLYTKFFNIKLFRGKREKEYCLIVSFDKDDDSKLTLYINLVKDEPKEKHFVTNKLSYYTEDQLKSNRKLGLPYIYSTHIVDEIVYEYSPTLIDREDLVILYRQSNNRQKEKDIIIRMIAAMHVLLEDYQERAEYEHHGSIDRDKLNSRIREINSLYGELKELVKRLARKELFVNN